MGWKEMDIDVGGVPIEVGNQGVFEEAMSELRSE